MGESRCWHVRFPQSKAGLRGHHSRRPRPGPVQSDERLTSKPGTLGAGRQLPALLGVPVGCVNSEEPVMIHDTRRNYFLIVIRSNKQGTQIIHTSLASGRPYPPTPNRNGFPVTRFLPGTRCRAGIWPALWFPRVLLVLEDPRGISGPGTDQESKGSAFPGQSDVWDQNAGRRDNLQTSAGTRRFLSVCLPFSAIIHPWASCRPSRWLNPDQYGAHLRD